MPVTNLAPGDTIAEAWVDAVYDSLGADWTNWATAAWANLTVGAGVKTGGYKLLTAHLCLYWTKFVFGAGSAFTGWPTVTPPVAIVQHLQGEFTAVDVSAGLNYIGKTLPNGANVGPVLSSLATLGQVVFASATVPFTWASGDSIKVAGMCTY